MLRHVVFFRGFYQVILMKSLLSSVLMLIYPIYLENVTLNVYPESHLQTTQAEIPISPVSENVNVCLIIFLYRYSFDAQWSI